MGDVAADVASSRIYVTDTRLSTIFSVCIHDNKDVVSGCYMF